MRIINTTPKYTNHADNESHLNLAFLAKSRWIDLTPFMGLPPCQKKKKKMNALPLAKDR